MAVSEYFKREKMNGLNGQDYVYKYIPLKYLIPLVVNKKLRIDKVAKWEDPYENFFLKSYFYTYASFYKQIVQVSTDEIRNRTYGQSWTMIEESDAMWRIYSNKDDIENIAVKVKIKIDNLFNIVYTSDECMATTSIGPVNYKTNLDIINWLGNLKNTEYLGLEIPKYAKESLFIKRTPFAHEKEVRIIISKDTQTPAEEFLLYDIPDLNVIEDFTLDPRLNEEDEVQITQKLEDIGVDRHKIKKSSLYEFTPVDLRI
jgi:hypothetical protein